MEDKLIIEGALYNISKGVKDNAASINQRFPVNSMAVEASNSGGQLTAAPHAKYLLKGNGSAPGKMRPVEPILDWIIQNNIPVSPRENKDGTFGKVSKESFAWGIAVNQMKYGSAIFQGKKPGVDLNSVLEKEIPLFLAALAKNKAATIASAMRSALMILLVLCCSCSNRVHATKIKKEKTVTVGQTFLMVGCFMLGYGLTNEYLIEK